MPNSTSYKDMNYPERVADFHKHICEILKTDLTFNEVRMYFEQIFILRRVQGQMDRDGDMFLNKTVEQMFKDGYFSAYKPSLQSKIKDLMKSNFFLAKRYKQLGFPSLNTFFDQEKNSRNFKVHASLIEFILAVIFKKRGAEEAKKVLVKIIFSEILKPENLATIFDLLKEMELERTKKILMK